MDSIRWIFRLTVNFDHGPLSPVGGSVLWWAAIVGVSGGAVSSVPDPFVSAAAGGVGFPCGYVSSYLPLLFFSSSSCFERFLIVVFRLLISERRSS